MAGRPTIAIDIVSDASRATKGLDDAADATKRLGREARTASDRIDDVGSKSGQTTSGLRDMADAVALAGFPGLSAAMTTAAVGFEAIDGAATLFAATGGFLTKALGGVTKAMNFLKVSILTNPIFIIAAVLVAIVAVFVLLYTRCETFRRIVDAVFKAVLGTMKGVWNWLVAVFSNLFDVLKKPFEMWAAILGTIFGKVRDVVGGLVEHWKDVFGKVYDFLTAPFRRAMEWFHDHFKLPSLPSWLPGVGKGAAASSVFLPTARGAAGAAAAPGAGPTIVIQAGVGDPHEIARQIRRLLREDAARLGRPPVWGAA